MLSVPTTAQADGQLQHHVLSRRSFSSLISIATTATVAAAVTSVPQSAFAAATDDIALRMSLRNLKLCQRKLSTLQDVLLMQQDYSAFKAALRTEPFSTLRKASTTIVRWTEENSTDTSTVSQIEEQYKTMIRTLEGVDTLATLALRGKKMGDTEASKSYLSFSQALDSFIQMSPQITAAAEVD